MKKSRVTKKIEKSAVFDTVTVYVPNRRMRRAISGRICTYCGNRLHFKDISGVENQDLNYTDYVHPRCISNAVENSSATSDPAGRKQRRSRKPKNKEIITDEKA